MPRRGKKEKKVMVIGSMVVSVADGDDIGAGDTYKVTEFDGKPWLPRFRKELPYEEKVHKGMQPDGITPIIKIENKTRPLSTCEGYMHFVWDGFEDTEGSRIASYINFWIMFLIVCSAIVAVVETIPAIHKSQKTLWFVLESVFVFFFTIEFVCRAISCPRKGEFVTTVMNWIDLVAILPFYIDIIMIAAATSGDPPNFGFLRILRLSRAARLIKLSKYSQGIRLVTNAMANSVDALQLFALLLTLVLVVFSSGIYYTERGDWLDASDGCPKDWVDQYGPGGTECGTSCSSNTSCIKDRYYRSNDLVGGNGKIERFPSPFQSIPQSFWWCIVTLTTVGYGDMYPYSVMGKVVGVLTMLVGLIMLALPLSIIGTNFIEERNIMMEENKRRANDEEKANYSMKEHEEEEETPKFNMRRDLREVLAKADQLYDSTNYMSHQLKLCADLLTEMRQFQVKGPGEAAASPGAGSESQVGSGSGGGGEVAVEMQPVQVPVYAVPLVSMEQLQALCLNVLKRAIEEMKIWDPQGELPEMPAQIVDLLRNETKREPGAGDMWKNRLAMYEEASATASPSGLSMEAGGGRSCLGSVPMEMTAEGEPDGVGANSAGSRDVCGSGVCADGS